jgi:predicted Zn-dependent peptidase
MKTVELNNGLKLNILETKANTVAFGFGVKIGSAFEEKDKRGISHLLEHMLFKTNEKYKADEINKLIELSGGKVNAFTDRDITAFLFEVIPEGFEKALDIFFEMYKNKEFLEEEFNTEKEVVKSEITIYNSNPSYRIYDLVFLSLFGESDFGEPIAGSLETVDNIDKDYLERFKENYYTTDNTELFLVGNIKEKFIELINKTFGSLEETKSKKKKEPSVGEGKNILEEKEVDNIFAALAFGGKFKNKEELLEHLAMEELVSGGLSSLLFELRENYGLAYSIKMNNEFHNIGEKYFTDYFIFSGLNKNKENIYKEKLIEMLRNRFKKLEKDYIEGRKRYFKINAIHYDYDMFDLLGSEMVYKLRGIDNFLNIKKELENNMDYYYEQIKDKIEIFLEKMKEIKIVPTKN